MITAITGKVGSGKNLYAIMKIHEYAQQGRRVVCNFHVNLNPLRPIWKKWFKIDAPAVEQIPGRPCYADVAQLGKGGPREHRAGLLVLDEVGPLLNARTWQDKDRQQFIDWLLHSRKLAWDILLVVQNIGIIDKQIRIAVIESMVTCRRMDRMKALGLPLPRIHMAVERYGTEQNSPVSQRSFYRGTRFFECYDTTEIIGDIGGKADAVVIEPEPVRTIYKARDYWHWALHGWADVPFS